jgi:hypothetical protein
MGRTATRKNTPTWSDVKTKLVDFDRTGLMRLMQDLYNASKDNQTFLHARFALGDDGLKPYKKTIDRWIWPDPLKKPGYVGRPDAPRECSLNSQSLQFKKTPSGLGWVNPLMR